MERPKHNHNNSQVLTKLNYLDRQTISIDVRCAFVVKRQRISNIVLVVDVESMSIDLVGITFVCLACVCYTVCGGIRQVLGL